MREVVRWAVVCALVVAATVGPADAKWHKPAAGRSASGDPEIVLTFDDGPHQEYTAQILDELEARHLQAIFFWVGHRIRAGVSHIDQRMKLIDRAIRAGHLVGNHTVNHAKLCAVPRRQAERELDDNAYVYERLTGLPMRLVRIPYGGYCQQVIDLLAERQLTHLHWDIDPSEWRSHDGEATAAAIIGRLRHSDGRTVVLLHDTKPAAVRALPIVLDWVEAENARRRKEGGKRPFRILSGADLALERLQGGVLAWAADSAATAHTGLADAIGRVIPGPRPAHPATVSRR